MQRNNRWSRQHGFTLIELVVVMAVVALLTTVAAPSFASLIAGQRVRTLASEFHLALMQTRSEAIKRNQSVSLNATNGNWAGGWTVADPDNPTGTPLYTRTTRNASNVTVTSTVTTVQYTAAGRVNTSTSPSFVFTAANTSEVRCVSVDGSGRPYTNKASSC